MLRLYGMNYASLNAEQDQVADADSELNDPSCLPTTYQHNFNHTISFCH